MLKIVSILHLLIKQKSIKMQIKTKVNVEQEISINLEAPAFFRTYGKGAIAVINENNIYRVSVHDNYCYIQSGNQESMKSDFSYCKEENRISEETFIEYYNEARDATDLNIRLENKPSALEVQADQERKAEQW